MVKNRLWRNSIIYTERPQITYCLKAPVLLKLLTTKIELSIIAEKGSSDDHSKYLDEKGEKLIDKINFP